MKRISYFKVIVVLLILLSLGNIAYALSLPTTVNGKSTLSDLPLLEYSVNGNRNYFVILLTGNGGWRSLVTTLTTYLHKKQVPVVSLNSLKYLWVEKNPQCIARDLERIMGFYSEKWNKSYVVLIGYSMGAEILPFALNNLSEDYLMKIQDVILIAPAQKATFEIAIRDYLYDSDVGLEILPELKNLKIDTPYCICDDKKISLCSLNLENAVEFKVLPGGHHFGYNYETLNRLIGTRMKLE